jgi:phosphoketolase
MASALNDVKETTKKAHTGARLSYEELSKINAYWRACNYLAAGMTTRFRCSWPPRGQHLESDDLKK